MAAPTHHPHATRSAALDEWQEWLDDGRLIREVAVGLEQREKEQDRVEAALRVRGLRIVSKRREAVCTGSAERKIPSSTRYVPRP